MKNSRRDLLPSARFSALWILIALCFPAKIYGIRKDIGLPGKLICRNTVQGRYLLADDRGYVCTALSIDRLSRCCPEKGNQFSCQGCNLVSQCCNSYEYCVSCCLNPSKTPEDLALKAKIAKPVTAASAFMEPNAEAKLAGVDVIVGRQGESCNAACRSKGRSCILNRLLLLNKCDYLQKYMRCKGSCFASMGEDQPAEVVDDAPGHMNPGACLYTQAEAMLSCDGSHQHTRRLCPCA